MKPDANSDHVGTRLTFGTDDEYEVQAPAWTTDRICAALMGCMSKQYELKAPTKTSDRVGAKVTEDDMKTQYQVRASTQNSEGCAEKDGCDEDTVEAMSRPGQFQSKPPTRTTDRQCKDIIKFAANEHQVGAHGQPGPQWLRGDAGVRWGRSGGQTRTRTQGDGEWSSEGAVRAVTQSYPCAEFLIRLWQWESGER